MLSRFPKPKLKISAKVSQREKRGWWSVRYFFTKGQNIFQINGGFFVAALNPSPRLRSKTPAQITQLPQTEVADNGRETLTADRGAKLSQLVPKRTPRLKRKQQAGSV